MGQMMGGAGGGPPPDMASLLQVAFLVHKVPLSLSHIIFQAGQQLAQQMQQSNPELVEQLRRQMGGGDDT